MIDAVIFDFDGTIFDSETHEYESVRELFLEHGHDLALEVWAQCVGRVPGYFDAFAHLEELAGTPLDRDALLARRQQRFTERIAGQGAMPGVEALLLAAREMGLKVGLASSSPRSWVHRQLRALGLFEHFDCIRTNEDVRHGKPEPDLYLSAADCLGVAPGRALAIEDLPNGALAARRAGLYCVVVPNRVTAALEFGEHDVRLESLSGAGLADLLGRVARARGGPAANGEPSPNGEAK